MLEGYVGEQRTYWREDIHRRVACNVVGRLGVGVRRRVRADAAQRLLSLSVSELRAGAALFLAGFSSGRSVGARAGDGGGNSECGMRNSELGCVAVLCGDAVLLACFEVGSRLLFGRFAGCFVSIPCGSGLSVARFLKRLTAFSFWKNIATGGGRIFARGVGVFRSRRVQVIAVLLECFAVGSRLLFDA